MNQLLNTVREGEELSKQLLSEATRHENRTKEDTADNCAEKSLKVVENLLVKLNLSKNQLEKLWHGKKKKLDYWVQLKNFEREFNICSKRQVEWIQNWEAKSLASDFTKSQNMLQKFTSESREMDKSILNICNRGQHVFHVLQECGVEVSLSNDNGIKVNSLTYMENTLKSLEEQKIDLLASRKKMQKKLEQCVQLRRLELDAKRVAGWIRHGENILQANVEAGSSLVEAEALLREYEQFQIAIEVCLKFLFEQFKSQIMMIFKLIFEKCVDIRAIDFILNCYTQQIIIRQFSLLGTLLSFQR